MSINVERCVRLGATIARAGAILCLLALLSGCDIYPKDAFGSLERIRSGQPLRVGWVTAEPWVRAGSTIEPAGLEPDLIRSWAQSLGARVEFVEASESQLVEALQENVIDIAVAGFRRDNPWGGKIGTTQPYFSSQIEIGVSPGVEAPANWEGIGVHYRRGRIEIAASIRQAGAVPVPVSTHPLPSPAAAYAFEMPILGLIAVRRLGSEERLIATAPAESALTLALDRFLHARRESIRSLAAGSVP